MAETPNMQELMQRAKEMQDQMKRAQEKILSLSVTGEAGGGLVKITMNGGHQALAVEISPTLMGEEEDMIADLVKAAINDASKKVEEMTKKEMMQIAKDMKLPENMGGAAE